MVHGRWQGEVRQWEKAPGHPVCDVDLAADDMLRERLMALDPEAGWLSEESADDAERLTRVRVWVVDPIDGTRDFLRGRAGWAVSVALVEGGRPLIGVLDAPARNEHWLAQAGSGAWRIWSLSAPSPASACCTRRRQPVCAGSTWWYRRMPPPP